MSADTALTIVAGIVSVVVFVLFFTNICDEIDRYRYAPKDSAKRPVAAPPASESKG